MYALITGAGAIDRLALGSLSLVSNEAAGGTPCEVLQIGTKFKEWISPRYGWAPVRIEALDKRVADSDVWTYSRQRKIAQGVWLPYLAIQRVNTGVARRASFIEYTLGIAVKRFHLDSAPRPAAFTPSLQRNTEVFDQRFNPPLHYTQRKRWASINDRWNVSAAIRRQQREIRTLANRRRSGGAPRARGAASAVVAAQATPPRQPGRRQLRVACLALSGAAYLSVLLGAAIRRQRS